MLSSSNDWFDGYYALAGLDTLYWHIFGHNIKLQLNGILMSTM